MREVEEVGKEIKGGDGLGRGYSDGVFLASLAFVGASMVSMGFNDEDLATKLVGGMFILPAVAMYSAQVVYGLGEAVCSGCGRLVDLL